MLNKEDYPPRGVFSLNFSLLFCKLKVATFFNNINNIALVTM